MSLKKFSDAVFKVAAAALTVNAVGESYSRLAVVSQAGASVDLSEPVAL